MSTEFLRSFLDGSCKNKSVRKVGNIAGAKGMDALRNRLFGVDRWLDIGRGCGRDGMKEEATKENERESAHLPLVSFGRGSSVLTGSGILMAKRGMVKIVVDKMTATSF